MITIGRVVREEIEAAAARTRNVVRHTPLTLVESGAFPGTVMLKLEHLQHAGTVAVRGLFNHILYALEQRSFDADAGLSPAGPPSMETALAHVARTLDLPISPQGALPCGADSPEVIAGLGTVGLELWTQTLGRIDTVIVPASCEALAVGIEAALAGQVRVLVASATASRAAQARRVLWQERRLVVDETTATAYAYLVDTYPLRPDEHVAVVLASALCDLSVQ